MSGYDYSEAAKTIREEIERAARITTDLLEELRKQMAVTTEAIRALSATVEKVASALAKVLVDMEKTRRIEVRPLVIGEVKNAQDFLEGLGGEQMTVRMSYECHEESVGAIDQVYDDGWIRACGRSFMPNVTPGEVVEFKGQRLMVTEINNDLVFFDPVEPEPSADDPEG